MDIKPISQLPTESRPDNSHDRPRRLWIGTYITIALAGLAAWLLLQLKVFEIWGRYLLLAKKISMGVFLAALVMICSKTAEGIVLKRSHTKAKGYNLIRLIRFVGLIVIALIVISVLFQNWYTAAVSLGLISLLLGFAFQTPISSLAAWAYIVIRTPYRVGDRIQINNFKGDVVEINYLDTTLWEFGGDYISSDLATGRLIRFPNSLLFESAVFNYSWQKFPYIWNEIPFHIAYESDLQYVEDTMRTITKNILGPETAEHIQELKAIIKQTAVDEVEIREYPYVTFRTNANTWVEATITYLVEPKKAAAIRTRIIKQVIPELLKQPDKVMFPKSNSR
jgi:small-conductance mechanosensitive channel